VEEILAVLRQRFGTAWGNDAEANLHFSTDVELLLREVEGVHLIGEPLVEEGQVTFSVWVDFPIEDLMSADQLAFDIFSRISEEIFYMERQFDARGIRYPFLTGSSREGHIGTLTLAGPHAADFADRHKTRITGGVRFHA
jgi:hypothetical protein